MNYINRKGLNVKVAFESNFNKKTIIAFKHKNILEKISVMAAPTNQFWFKRLSLAVVKYIYRLLKSTLRPIAFRVRSYLIDGLRHEIQQEIQKASATTAQGIQQRLDLISEYSRATARRIAINCGANEVLVRTEVGFLLCSASDHLLLSCLLDSGELERGTRVLIQKYLRPGDVYIDVGANIGIHTLAAAKAMQGQGKIIAFEPFEPTMRMLEKSICMNGFSSITEFHQAAVSNTTGKQKLFIGRSSDHCSLFVLEPSLNNAQDSVEVPLVRLDGVIASGQRIDLIKIDVEGSELNVIEGGTSLIASNSNIALIIEFGPSHLRRTGHTPSQWFKLFNQLGLDYRVINNETGVLEKWSLNEMKRAESINLFMAFPESAAWDRLL